MKTIAPSCHHTLLTDPKWQAALGRKAGIDKVLSFVVEHWAQLQKHPPHDMASRQPEPKITKFFGVSLAKHAKAHGITGIFIPEHNVADIEEVTQELQSCGRTDITYFSDSINPPLELVFEFKKLKGEKGGKALRAKYCSHGVVRFVNGIYARGADVGFMVGLIEKNADGSEVISSLSRTLQGSDMRTFLRMITDSSGKVVTVPPATFAQCEFETRHARDHAKNCPNMVLGHLILTHT